jgi:hypothetical protein
MIDIIAEALGLDIKSNFHATPKKKKDQLSLAQYGDKLSPANRPDPDDPGGLGAEESGAERTGSTQEYLLAIQHGGRWAEVGQYYDFANDPVTACFGRETQLTDHRTAPEFRDRPPLQRGTVGAIMSRG